MIIDSCAWLDGVAANNPDRPFMEVHQGTSYSYRQSHELSSRLAATLASLGIRAGDRIAVQAEKSGEYLLLYLASLRLGTVFLPLNTAYTLAELEYFLGDAQPALIIVDPDRKDAVVASAARVCSARVETLDRHGCGTLMELARSIGTLGHSAVPFSPDDVAVLLYTSGTTGRSKGAMLTRGNLSSNAAALARAWDFSQSDVLLHALPVFHVHGLLVATNTVLASGSSMLLLPKFDANDVIRQLHRATVFMGVPTFYTRLLQHSDLTKATTARIRLFVSGSAPLLTETHREFQARTGHAILERYGMTETLMNTSNPYVGGRVPGAVGPPLPGIELRITDAETGKPLQRAGEIGMIEVRGPNVFKGYWRMPEKTAAEFRADGYFVTGDLGKIDEHGYVHIVGRGKDLIISGGYNVYPKEVESEIDALPGVMESAVIGIAHSDFGEGVTAVVVPKPGATLDEQTMLETLARRLAKFKLPKRILIVEDLPRNTMGKVQKNVLRETFAEIYKASSA